MNKLIQTVLRSDPHALDSLDAFTKAALTLGYSQEEIDRALDELDGSPLDDGLLDEVAGGYISHRPTTQNKATLPDFLF